MTAYSALSPVSAAIVAALQDTAFATVCPGGVFDDVPQGPTYPFLLYVVDEKPIGGLGTKPGVGRTLEITIRLHVYSQFAGMTEAQAVLREAIRVMFAQALTVDGYKVDGEPFHDENVSLPDELVGGQKVKELVGLFRLYVTEQ